MRSFFYRSSFVLSILFFFSLPILASANTLGITPASGSYTVGKTFPVSVYVTSTAQSINAVSGTVTFPPSQLQVVSVSKAGSVLTLWVQDPSFSNSAGTVTFEGVVPNPGFQGSNGRVLTINFKVISSGSADIKFGEDSSVLANDGSGTNILKNLNPASYSLEYPVSAPTPAVSPSPATNPAGFTIKLADISALGDPQPKFSVTVSGDVSNVDHYTAQIDDGPVTTWQDDGSGTYQVSGSSVGSHTLSIVGYDTAGDAVSSSIDFAITATPAPAPKTFPFPNWLKSLLSYLTSYLAIIVPLIALLFALLYVLMHGVHKVHMSRSKFQKELRDVEHLVDKAFSLLKEDIEDSIRLLERTRSRRKLTQEEDRMIERLRQNLHDAEEVIHGEVRKVEKELD